MTQSKPIQLQYGHPANRWPVCLRRAGICGVLLAVGLAAYFAIGRWGMDVWLWTQMLWAQHRCLTYTEPPERVVLEQGLASGPMAERPGYEQRFESGYVQYRWVPPDGVIYHFSDLWQCVELNHLTRWSGSNPFVTSAVGDEFQPSTVFLHAMRAGGSPERLVWVVIWIRPEMPRSVITQCVVFETATPGHKCKWVGYGGAEQIGVGAGSKVKYYAGQADPADSSHFTIMYETADGRGTIDGRLNADNNVKVTVIQPQITTRAALH